MNNNSENNQPEKLYFTTKLAYGAGDLGAAITANILIFFLMYFFTQVAGLPPGLAGSILMIGKIADAINDPIVGVLSDRTRTRWGRRLPWILWGIIPFGLFFFLQWLVPHFSNNDTINDWWLFIYYVLIGILFNIAYTMVNLPYTALTPELSQDYHERTSLNSFRFAFSIGGSILSLILARIIFSAYPDDLSKQYLMIGLLCGIISVVPIIWCVFRIQERGSQPFLNLQQKQIMGRFLTITGIILTAYGILRFLPKIGIWLGANKQPDLTAIMAILLGILVILFGITLWFAKTEDYLENVSAKLQREQNNDIPILPFQEQLKIVFRNQAFLYVIGIYLCSWLAVQLTASILPYFVVSRMGLPDQVFPQVALAVQGTALIMLFVNNKISQRFGKKTVYFLGMSLWIIVQGCLFFLEKGQVNLMYLLAILAGFGVSVAYLIPWSMVPDVIELDELETGQRREGIFYGFMVLLQKFGLAFALFLIGQALEVAGFIETVSGQPIPSQPDSALLAIRIAIGPLPTIALVAGLILAYFYPITQSVHAEIRLKLQERKLNPKES